MTVATLAAGVVPPPVEGGVGVVALLSAPLQAARRRSAAPAQRVGQEDMGTDGGLGDVAEAECPPDFAPAHP
ncbi:MAG: hypothetical protein KJT01_16835, partial [Gemmatimonadetes bacterium]|nr:hypothetical protein [Gemmatimonadota bacterium]